MNKKYTTGEFIEKAKAVHHDKYDYNKVNYINNHTKIIITCKIHGDFEQIPSNHLNGANCPWCSGKAKHNLESFIKFSSEVHDNKYDYSKVNYIGRRIKVLIGCPIHGDFLQLPSSHLIGQGCPKCGIVKRSENRTKTTDQFISEAILIHKQEYDYSLVQYKGKDIPVEIICKEHGIFKQRPHSHLNGAGCPKCLLKSQQKLFSKLVESFPKEKILFEAGKSVIPWIGRLRIDIYFPVSNIAVEYDGRQHFEKVPRFENGKEGLQLTLYRDQKKNKLCEEHNCKLFRIKYNYSVEDYNNLVNNIKQLII